ncbi:peroxiredoxin [Pedobacter sp. L105]|uniref:peroxiredoxin family protein n=1 Tax=Pedobacter sp. L105 TaxID=1641871 RepID=UPI00131D4E68|nr:TlpA disulfide reductase family protein [Pedobacter sp. L105]
MESHNNFSYQSVEKLRDMSADTTVIINKELFLKAPPDKVFGYHYSIESNYKTETFHNINLYNGEGITILSLSDSTFFQEKEALAYDKSLIGGLKSIKDRYNHKPFKITKLKDTVIDRVAKSHLVANLYDTLDNNVHLYLKKEYYIDKQTGLPSLVIIKGRYKYEGLVNEYYDETKYFDYKFDISDINDSNFAIPKGFKPRKTQTAPLALLNRDTTAPNWMLYDAKGNKVSLSQLKGKVVMLDFYYIGCSGCMASIIPLNTIYEKYKNKDLIIASLTERDSKKAVLDFETRYKIKYTGYINAAECVKSYHVTTFPTFYFIDKDGKVVNAFVGYSKDFEAKVTSIIDTLLSKK